MSERLRILFVEDNESDVALCVRSFEKGGFEVFSQRVETKDQLENALRNTKWDIVFSDFYLPKLDAPTAFAIFQTFNLDIPFIVISGEVGEEAIVNIIKAGAQDYVMKSNSGKLPFVVKRALAEAKARKELAQAHKNLIESNLALENALMSRDEFLSVASHELKTPLAPLKLLLQVVQRKINNSDQTTLDTRVFSDHINMCLKNVNHLSNLIETLLDISRLSIGSFAIHSVKRDLDKFVSEIVNSYRGQAKANGSDLTYSSNGEMFVSFDTDRLQQVMSNLLSNAIKFGEGKPIEVGSFVENGNVTVRIKDHGIGINADEQKIIFDRYERVKSKLNVTGLGLGLYISRQIIIAHGGELFVESSPGKGSTFSFRLALAESDPV